MELCLLSGEMLVAEDAKFFLWPSIIRAFEANKVAICDRMAKKRLVSVC
jgi:hypothetical protein